MDDGKVLLTVGHLDDDPTLRHRLVMDNSKDAFDSDADDEEGEGKEAGDSGKKPDPSVLPVPELPSLQLVTNRATIILPESDGDDQKDVKPKSGGKAKGKKRVYQEVDEDSDDDDDAETKAPQKTHKRHKKAA